MISSINKQQLVRERLARELLVLYLNGMNHLRPVQQYAEGFGVGRGTVQSAFQELKAMGAITLNACGARGTFLAKVDRRKLFDACGYGELICLMPLDANHHYRSLATGIYESISARELPIHILFARGSRNRTKILVRQKCDFAIMSLLAYETAVNVRKDAIESVGKIGEYPGDLGVVTREGRPYVPGETKVAFDDHSYDQCALHALFSMRDEEPAEYLNVQLADMVRQGRVEAAICDRSSLGSHAGLRFHPLELSEAARVKLRTAVAVVRQGDASMRELLLSVLEPDAVSQVQKQVLAGERLVKY